MDKIEIRQASINHVDQLQKIGRQTFYETFSESNTEENMKSYLENGFSAEKIETELVPDMCSPLDIQIVENRPPLILGYLNKENPEYRTAAFA